MRIVTAAEMKAADEAAIAKFGVPALLLMEHAAIAIAAEARARRGPHGRVLVVTGAGNNGGDGWAAARLLHRAGVPVKLFPLVAPEALEGEAVRMARAYLARGGEAVRIPTEEAELPLAAGPGDVVVDAIFGTGLTRAPEGRFARAIASIATARAAGAFVLAVDLPSGLSADEGRPPGACVQADATVTFAALKRGLVLEPGVSLSGTVTVAEIGIPEAAFGGVPSLVGLEEEGVRALVPARLRDAHKGSCGHVLLVAGSHGKTGAASLCARAVLVGGAGLVTILARPGVMEAALAQLPEAMGAVLPGEGALGLADVEAIVAAAEGKSALVVGPGIPRGAETGKLLARLLAEIECPVVLDADALNALEDEPAVLKGAATAVVVTPHPGEMARLAGIPVSLVQEDRLGTAQRFAREHHCVTVLKGAGTVIAEPEGATSICRTGNPGLATAGSGDVLAGLLGALLAQGLPAAAAASVAVHLHGAAGDDAIRQKGVRGLLASDVIDAIAARWAAWSR